MRDMYVDGITKIGNALGLEGDFLIEFGFDQIMDIIAPPPEMELVEVRRWELSFLDGSTTGSIVSREDEATEWAGGGDNRIAVLLTGSFQRPKRVKVERSVSVAARVHNDGHVQSVTFDSFPFSDTDACGKCVTLTAAWEE